MATSTCRSISAVTVDEAVAERLLDALNPEEVALAWPPPTTSPTSSPPQPGRRAGPGAGPLRGRTGGAGVPRLRAGEPSRGPQPRVPLGGTAGGAHRGRKGPWPRPRPRPHRCRPGPSSRPSRPTCPSWLVAWERAFTALRQASRTNRRDSTGPSADFGSTVASPASTARAALTASTVSFLPSRRRRWRFGRLTSTTATPLWRRRRPTPEPSEPVPSTPTRSRVRMTSASG